MICSKFYYLSMKGNVIGPECQPQAPERRISDPKRSKDEGQEASLEELPTPEQTALHRVYTWCQLGSVGRGCSVQASLHCTLLSLRRYVSVEVGNLV